MNQPGRQAIHRDAMLPPVMSQAHGELFDAASTRSVRTQPGITGDAGDGSHIDNSTVFLVDHMPGDRLSDEKQSAKIGIQHQIPILPGNF